MVDYVNWAGASGVVYRFEVLAVGNELAVVAGVYIFAQKTDAGFYAKYIGQAGNLKERIPGHEQISAAGQLGANQIHLMATSGSLDERRRIESDLIARWSPPLNDQG